jgi:hypothetical protein
MESLPAKPLNVSLSAVAVAAVSARAWLSPAMVSSPLPTVISSLPARAVVSASFSLLAVAVKSSLTAMASPATALSP